MSQIIASGSLISTEALTDVGLMEEDLFIDWVDLEWCWRARAKGWKIVGNANVVIDHRLGDRSAAIGEKTYPLRRPTRSYYIVRNALHLAFRHPALRFWERLGIGARAVRYGLGVTVLTRDVGHLKHSIAALRDAIRRRLGPM